MTKTDTSRPTISDTFDEFAGAFLPAARPSLAARFAPVMNHLEDFLDTEGENVLLPDDLRLLVAERAVDPIRAFVRTMHPDDLFYAIPHYLERHPMAGKRDRHAQLDIVSELCEWMWKQRLITYKRVSECAALEVEAALRNAREEG